MPSPDNQARADAGAGSRWFTIIIGLPGDLDDDGDVDQSDLRLLLTHYSEQC